MATKRAASGLVAQYPDGSIPALGAQVNSAAGLELAGKATWAIHLGWIT